ncbi:MAG: class I SAM-dependent methyltransferase [Candidatus Dormibacteria bacterium]
MDQPTTRAGRWPGRDGDEYDSAFRTRERAGMDVHGEADFVESFHPRSVLDAGCGTGRVAIELSRRGIDVAGIDVDEGMLTTALRKAPQLLWILGDLSDVTVTDEEGSPARFDLVVAAGNVMIFLAPGSEARVVGNLGAHLAPGGLLVAGFQLIPNGLDLDAYDRHAAAAGLRLSERWSTWDRRPFDAGGDYAVSVHCLPA